MNFVYQHDQMDCGPACLCMIASFYGKEYSLQYLRENSFITREGVSLLGIVDAAENIGLKTYSVRLTIDELIKMPMPCILHWNQNHFVVLAKVKNKPLNILFNKRKNLKFYKILDPAHGPVLLSEDAFSRFWLSNENKGVVLFLSPTEKFYMLNPIKNKTYTIRYLTSYLNPYKKQLAIMSFLLLIGSCITLILPFLTQNLIDKGINAKNIDIIQIILLAQLSLFLGSLSIEIFRNRIMLYIGSKISINIISDFLKKLLKLPIKFFDIKVISDFNQRIQDHERIENFLTSQSLLTFFSMISFSVFLIVLFYYGHIIAILYIGMTLLSISWTYLFFKKRKALDYFRFRQRSESQEAIYEIINGVTELKINQLEEFKCEEWDVIQRNLFKTNLRILRLDQVQISGFDFINQIKNILVTFFTAKSVVNGSITLGELLSVSYIIGQMNSPINQLISLFRSLQYASLSLERLKEVQNYSNEENSDLIQIEINETKNSDIQFVKGIKIRNVSFQYEGPKSRYILNDINLFIPEGKITAIVGASGSGKTTLMKLLLKFYEPTNGEILLSSNNLNFGTEGNEINLNNISPTDLRKNCGVVMQDGYIFSNSISKNITTADKEINNSRFSNAIEIANLNEFIQNLPLKYNTKIGASGIRLSGGQIQRILIARAVYKNPNYIFFDEATSALDAENEKIIHDRLLTFFKGKTVLIIAHRLSTVKNADQIVVLKNGRIVEQGNHNQLVRNEKEYFNLVKNQLELGV